MAKPKLKTDPIAVRFNIERFNLIKEKEKLETPQQVVNFLMEKYEVKKESQLEPENNKKHFQKITDPINNKKATDSAEPKEGSGAFWLKYGVETIAEIQKK